MSATQMDIFKILLGIYFGYKFLTNYRKIKLFAKNYHGLPEAEKEKYDLKKGSISAFQKAGTVNLPKPLAIFFEIVVALLVLFMLSFMLSVAYVGIFQ